ncbi:OmpA family protein [Noviluteimonas gilva]|uniref:OmpA family protein n=1 Tax=Noviluteimonas gilva TaxID=2682097 RepID=A0A7C9M073_9GAMM|nr:OmpA family protein [Lysobacter gilvus]MUV13428.1 OmpA family protein [Lysobacter gilvus]
MKTFSVGRCALLALVLSLAGCATQPPAPDAPLPFDEAVAKATDRLVAQLPAFSALPLLAARNITHDPSLDVETGQQTGATRTLDSAIARNIAERHSKLTLLPFQSSHLANARYLLASTMAREAGQHAGALRIEMALVERESGNVVAQASALASNEGLDHAPLPYYRDSPVLVKDRVVEGYIRTAATARGQRGDAFYLERIAVATAVNEATELYNQARYREALGEYRSALAVPAGEQMRVLNGIYLANVKLDQAKEAEEAFGRVVAMGIAYRQLSVKFLYNPGTVAFFVDPRISTPYPMWLRQIAREAQAAKTCMDIVGHTSRTGRVAANDALSLRRATDIQRRLVREVPELASRTQALGMGFRENIIGTGSDDAIDVLDRRVEFRIQACGAQAASR